jgi:hypothetical protein
LTTKGWLAAKTREMQYRTRYVANVHPWIYMPFARRWHADMEHRFVDPDTELVVEGFGRSGSTFAMLAFDLAQQRPVKTAHHTHAAAQVVVAARLGIPTLVIIRDPMDATLAHMVRRKIPAKPALQSWVRYHRHVLPYKDRILAVPLASVSSDVGAVIRAVNERFGTAFKEFDHTKENEAHIFELIEAHNLEKYGKPTYWVARPTATRLEEKDARRRELDDPRLATLRERARAIYGSLIPSTSRS